MMHPTEANIRERLRKLYQDWSEHPVNYIVPLKGDASSRRIYRIHARTRSAIGVYGPSRDENRAFLSFTRAFQTEKLPVPELLYVCPDEDFYLLEDLGDETLFTLLNKLREKKSGFPLDEIRPHYQAAVEALAQFQTRGINLIDTTLCYQGADFDEAAWERDHRYFYERFVERLLPGFIHGEALRRELAEHRWMLREVSGTTTFLYRDFQSRNIMVTRDGLRFIDYQSGRRGSPIYDIASLLFDARADLPPPFRREIRDHYFGLLQSEKVMSMEEAMSGFQLYVLLRILQALGSYGNNGIDRGKREYLAAIPFALGNILTILSHDERQHRFVVLIDLLNRIQEERRWENYLQVKGQ